MSLLGRIRKSTVEPTPPLLPFALVKEFLETHPLIYAMGVAPSAVHETLLKLYERKPVNDDTTRTEPALWTARKVCNECGGYTVLHPEDGMLVCSSCGLVHACGLTLKQSYAEEPERRTVGAVKVPQWQSHMYTTEDPALPQVSAHWKDLQHWAGYCRELPESWLEEADRILRRWTGVEELKVRIAAVLVYLLIKDRIPEESELRARMHTAVQWKGRALVKTEAEPIQCAPPEGRFPCETCGRKWHVARDARVCCRKRRR